MLMLGTNTLIQTIKNRPEDVRRHVEAHHGEICASRIAAMDLLCGAHKFHAVRRNLRGVEGVLAGIDFDLAAVEQAGQIRADLASSGRSI
jgi:tRNA(fMet)-specific endonuclease VapC